MNLMSNSLKEAVVKMVYLFPFLTSRAYNEVV